MPLAVPWDLVTAGLVPPSVEWWALTGSPSAPGGLAQVQAVALPDLSVQVEYDPPEEPQPGRLAWRAFTALIAAPQSGGSFPYSVAALAFVETAGGQVLLGVFPLDAPVMLSSPGQSYEVQGFIQVSKYQ